MLASINGRPAPPIILRLISESVPPRGGRPGPSGGRAYSPRAGANRGRKTGHLAVDGGLNRCAIIALMRHLKNPDERPKTPALERAGHGPVGQVHEDTKALIGKSIADNTRLAYAAALNGLDAEIPLDRQDDARIADYLAALYRDGKSPASIALAVAAVQFRAKIAGTRSPVGEVARRTLAGIRKEGRDRGRGQARAVTYDQVIRMQAVAGQPRRRGRGMESPDVATRRGAEDAALVGLAFQAGLRRSEIAALRWADIQPSGIEGAVLIHVRASKMDPAGDRTDIRMAKNGTAEALDAIRPGAGEAGPVFGLTPGQINRRIQAAAAAAGIDGISAHSFRVGLASELTARGASTTETMLAGGWSTARMVAHYSAGAKAERGAVAKYL